MLGWGRRDLKKGSRNDYQVSTGSETRLVVHVGNSWGSVIVFVETAWMNRAVSDPCGENFTELSNLDSVTSSLPKASLKYKANGCDFVPRSDKKKNPHKTNGQRKPLQKQLYRKFQTGPCSR